MQAEDRHVRALRDFRIERGVPTGELPVKRLTDGATLPSYGSGDAAGLDLCADLSAYDEYLVRIEPDSTYNTGLTTAMRDHPAEARHIILRPGRRTLVKTGIAMALPRGTYGRVAPRSGLAFKHGIDVMAGVIDSDYRGEVGVILVNLGEDTFVIKHGDRIAQLVIERFYPCYPFEVLDLTATNRGHGGYGSTGV